MSYETTARADQAERAIAEQADDATGYFFMEFFQELRRQMAVAEAQATADAMAAIVKKYYP